MAVPTGALTLQQYAQFSNSPLIKEVSMAMVKAGVVFQDVPIVTRPSFNNPYARIDGPLPTIGYRELNEEPALISVNAKHIDEKYYHFSNSIAVDELLQLEENAIGNKGAFVNTQVKAYLASLRYELNDAFINNTHRTIANRSRSKNLKCFVGIRERLDNSDFNMTSSETKKQATADLSGTITGSDANQFVMEMQEVLDAMGFPEGDDCIIYVNDDLLRRVEYGIRDLGAGGGFDMTRDAFDRMVMTYRNAKFRRIGRKAPGASGTQSYIITSTESQDGAADTGSLYTSLYVVHYGESDGVSGWQFYPVKVEPKTTDDNGVIERVNIKGGYGLKAVDPRCIGRLHGVKVGT